MVYCNSPVPANHVSSLTVIVVHQLLDFIVAGQLSNSRITLSVRYYPRLQVRRLDTGQDKRPSLSVRTVTDKHAGFMATLIVFQLQEPALATWPSNSRTTLSVHKDPRLQARRLVNGQHKRLSLSAKIVMDIKLRQVPAQARQAMLTFGPLTELKL